MKPVNLLPSGGVEVVVASSAAGKPNMGAIGGAVAGGVALVAIAGYFAFARVDSIKSEADQFTQQATAATSETTSTRSQIQSLGQPVVDSDVELAKGAEKVLVSAYTERRDYVKAIRETLTLVEGTGGWYSYIDIASNVDSSGGGGKTIELHGFFPSKDAMAAFNERINSAVTIRDADTIEIKQKRRYVGGRMRMFWWVKLSANLVDTVPPYVSDPTAAPANKTDGTTVSDAGDDLTLSLGDINAAVKKKQQAKQAAPATPKNPFDVAATVAAGGSSK